MKYVLVLLSTPSYMFRRELRHLQGELYRMLRTILTLFGCRSAVRLHVGLQLYLQLFKKPFWFNVNTETCSRLLITTHVVLYCVGVLQI